MAKVIFVLGTADGRQDIRQYVREFDPDGGDAQVPYPTGWLDLTADVREARRFTTEEAFATWKAQSSRTPLRPDGLPNRPLTAFTVEIQDVPDA